MSRYLDMTSLFEFTNPKHVLSSVISSHLAQAGVAPTEGVGKIESRYVTPVLHDFLSSFTVSSHQQEPTPKLHYSTLVSFWNQASSSLKVSDHHTQWPNTVRLSMLFWACSWSEPIHRLRRLLWHYLLLYMPSDCCKLVNWLEGLQRCLHLIPRSNQRRLSRVGDYDVSCSEFVTNIWEKERLVHIE
jgi:hypothetical protein